VSILDDSGLLANPPRPLRRPAFWMALAAWVLLLLGLSLVAAPDSISGPVVWAINAEHGLRTADAIGSAMLVMGSALTWIISLIWQWQQTH
jgi:hypothetical protein